MFSVAESELVALFVTSKTMVPMRQTLIEKGCSQPLSLVKMENSTAVGVVNKTVIPKQTNFHGHTFLLFELA